MSQLPQTVLITGASRGIGLEFVRQLVKFSPKILVATCRNPAGATELQDIAKENDFVKILKLDVENDTDIDSAVEETKSLVGTSGLNLLINNAGIFLDKESRGIFDESSRENMQHHFNVNATSRVIVTQKFLPLLQMAASKATNSPVSCAKSSCVFISAIMASQSLTLKNGHGRSLNYKCSNTAANMAGIVMARDLEDSGILVFSLHPGWVQTDMGGPDADITAPESVEGMLEVIGSAREKHKGLVLNYRGQELPF